MHQIYNGIYKLTIGTPEKFTPVSLRNNPVAEQALATMPTDCDIPFSETSMHAEITNRGTLLELPLTDSEEFYGLGLQLKSFVQKGKKKMLRTNADPKADAGDSHAPVPFFVSTKGYGVFIDTARYVTFYFGSSAKKSRNTDLANRGAKGSVEELYAMGPLTGKRCITIEVPVASGVDIYLFTGPTLKEAVMRYNLFSGGGTLPPLWSLGIWYRTYFAATSNEVMRFAQDFREKKIPCSVIGLEPGWLKRSYSASFEWNEEKFPDHEQFIDEITDQGYRVNLWEHVFVHPEADMYDKLYPYAGDYEVWDGLVPDLSIPEAMDIFAEHHKRHFADKKISGFKIDECDSSDYTGCWSFPNCSKFPSGMDGEQMHSMLGILYQATMKKVFDSKNMRTMCLVRSSHALAAPYPFALYSDLYAQDDFLMGMVNMGFSGLLWTPEVRNANSVEDLIRRMQLVCLSPVALVNAWPFPYPPWWQINEDLNKKGIMMDNIAETENICRNIFRFRMTLIPYLYNAFHQYRTTGLPPYRALVMDYPNDREVWSVSNQFMIGDALLAAPLKEQESEKKFYLPKGTWVYFFDDTQVLEGEKWYTFPYSLDQFPLFVKAGTLLPLAEPVETITPDTKLKLVPKVFGNFSDEKAAITLYEDDGESNAYLDGDYSEIEITADKHGAITFIRKGSCKKDRYTW